MRMSVRTLLLSSTVSLALLAGAPAYAIELLGGVTQTATGGDANANGTGGDHNGASSQQTAQKTCCDRGGGGGAISIGNGNGFGGVAIGGDAGNFNSGWGSVTQTATGGDANANGTGGDYNGASGSGYSVSILNGNGFGGIAVGGDAYNKNLGSVHHAQRPGYPPHWPNKGPHPIGKLATLPPATLRASLDQLDDSDMLRLRQNCATILSEPVAYDRNTLFVCEVIMQL